MTPFYARTWSGTTRHIIDPDTDRGVLCSTRYRANVRDVSTYETDTYPSETRTDLNPEVWDLTPCPRCEAKAKKLGLVAPATRPEPEPHTVTDETRFVTVAAHRGKVHHASVDDADMIPLCRDSHGIRQHTTWQQVDGPLSCSHCIGYAKNRAAVRAKHDAVNPAPAHPRDAADTHAQTNCEDLHADEADERALADLFPGPTWEEIVRSEEETDPSEISAPTRDDDPSDYMFPGDVERVAKTYPLNARATGRNPRGARVAGVVTGYAQFGSARDGYTTVAEIDQEESTGEYAMLCEPTPEGEERTTRGAVAEHADNPVVVTILAVLENGGLEPAEIVGDDLSSGTVHGVVAVPRPDRGMIHLYWFGADGLTDVDGRRPAELADIRRTLAGAGYQLVPREPGSLAVKVFMPTADGSVHYRLTLAEHGAVCGAAALSADDPGMSNTPGAVTCPNCRAHLDTRPPLPRRTHNADRIGQACRKWLEPRLRVKYSRATGWHINTRVLPDMRDAVNHLVSLGQPRPDAFAVIAREQMTVMSADLPDGVTLYEDDHLGGYGYACTRALCTKRAGGFDYPGGAMHSARAHLTHSHPFTHGLPTLRSTWPHYE